MGRGSQVRAIFFISQGYLCLLLFSFVSVYLSVCLLATRFLSTERFVLLSCGDHNRMMYRSSSSSNCNSYRAPSISSTRTAGISIGGGVDYLHRFRTHPTEHILPHHLFHCRHHHHHAAASSDAIMPLPLLMPSDLVLGQVTFCEKS